MRNLVKTAIAVTMLTWTGLCAASDEGLLVSAAISLKPALEEINAGMKGSPLNFNFASSGALQQQIEQGAPVDIFIAAGEEPMQKLQRKGLIEDSSLFQLLSNTLVLAVPAKSASKLKDLAELKSPAYKKIAMGEPKTVPAGQYAQDALAKTKLAEALAPKIVFGNNVKQVLTYVETGDADAGFVYASDIKNNTKVSLAYSVPADFHRPIVYPAALVKSSKRRKDAEAALKELQSDRSRAIFQKYGFISSDKPTG